MRADLESRIYEGHRFVDYNAGGREFTVAEIFVESTGTAHIRRDYKGGSLHEPVPLFFEKVQNGTYERIQ